MYSLLSQVFHAASTVAGTDMRPIGNTGAMLRSGISSPSGEICSPTMRVTFVTITDGATRCPHGVRGRVVKAGVRSTATLSSA
jgi:hypothetical protein